MAIKCEIPQYFFFEYINALEKGGIDRLVESTVTSINQRSKGEAVLTWGFCEPSGMVKLNLKAYIKAPWNYEVHTIYKTAEFAIHIEDLRKKPELLRNRAVERCHELVEEAMQDVKKVIL